MKVIILYIITGLQVFALTIIGHGVSKSEAFEDAYIKYALNYGEIKSSFELTSGITLKGGVSISKLRIVPEVTLLACEKGQLYVCSYIFKERAYEQTNQRQISIPLCSNKDGPCHRYEIYELKKHSQHIVIKGFLYIKYLRYGRNIEVSRHSEEHTIFGIGINEKEARRSLQEQGDAILKKRRKSKEINDLVYRESLYEMYIKAHDEGDLKDFIKQDLYPVEVLSKGRNAIFFVKKLRGTSLLD